MAVATDPDVSLYWSPHHRYCCEVRRSDDSDEIVSFKGANGSKLQKLISTPRWADVLWSPDDAWFCIDDNWDPDNNRLHVYHAFHNGIVELVWSTFDSAPDTYWKVLGWNMDKGLIHVQCDYLKDYNRPPKGSLVKTYWIPIFLPQQITGDDVF